MEAPQAIHSRFASLGKTGKPVAGEWTVIAGITAENDGSHVAVALGTGTKCLSASQVWAVLNEIIECFQGALVGVQGVQGVSATLGWERR